MVRPDWETSNEAPDHEKAHWVRLFGGSERDDGGVALAGYGAASQDDGLGMWKLGGDGTTEWARTYGMGSGEDIVQNPDGGDYVVTGRYQDSSPFDALVVEFERPEEVEPVTTTDG